MKNDVTRFVERGQQTRSSSVATRQRKTHSGPVGKRDGEGRRRRSHSAELYTLDTTLTRYLRLERGERRFLVRRPGMGYGLFGGGAGSGCGGGGGGLAAMSYPGKRKWRKPPSPSSLSSPSSYLPPHKPLIEAKKSIFAPIQKKFYHASFFSYFFLMGSVSLPPPSSSSPESHHHHQGKREERVGRSGGKPSVKNRKDRRLNHTRQ